MFKNLENKWQKDYMLLKYIHLNVSFMHGEIILWFLLLTGHLQNFIGKICLASNGKEEYM